MNDVERWLEPRLVGVPEVLGRRILQAVRSEAGNGRRGEDGQAVPGSRFTLHDRLLEAGNGLLAEAMAMPPSHDTAVTLLAADALMTFACEAMAETNPEALGNVSGERWG